MKTIICIHISSHVTFLRVFVAMLAIFFSETSAAQLEKTITNGHETIHYKSFGSGAPILIINGGPGMNSNGFVPLAEKLCENNTVIVYDQRGTGKSSVEKIDDTTITLDLMIADIEKIRTDLAIENWIVLGHSFGGMLASYYASQHPDRLNALILSSSGGSDLSLLGNIDVNSKLTQMQRDSLRYWNQRIAQGDTTFHAKLQRGMNLAPAYLYNKTHTSIVAKRLTEGNSEINGLVWQNMRSMQFNCTDALKNYKKPVLILQGKNDILDISIAENSHKIFKNSTLVLMDECGHYGWLDQPEKYFYEIHSFLTTIEKS